MTATRDEEEPMAAMGPQELVEPDWDGEPLEVLEQLADLAIVAVHYLLDYAGPESTARLSANMLLDFLRTEVAGTLKERMPEFCPECGTSGGKAVMDSSRRHRAHLARPAPSVSGADNGDNQ